jgi:hypothetical protein
MKLDKFPLGNNNIVLLLNSKDLADKNPHLRNLKMSDIDCGFVLL